MEKVYKNDKGYFGETSGLMYPSSEVYEVNECYWHCHPSGQPVIDVHQAYEDDTRVHGGYPKYPPSGKGNKTESEKGEKGEY